MALSIEELVGLSLEDPRYISILWKRMEPLCLKWANKLKGVDYAFEDLYQESYLILIQTLESYEPEKSVRFEAYFKLLLYRWGWNYAHKKKAMLIEEEEEKDFWEMLQDESEQVEEGYIHKELIQTLSEGLKSLSSFEYNLLVDFYIKELKMTQIARLYQLEYKMVETRKRRILKKLQKFFDAF